MSDGKREPLQCEVHGEKITKLEEAMNRVEIAIFGDVEMKIKGLVDRTEENFNHIKRIEVAALVTCACVLGLTGRAVLPVIFTFMMKIL